jgi:hypothetical protein
VQTCRGGTYEDPQGRFSLPIPTNWTVEEKNGLVTLSDPGGDIQVPVLTLEGGDPEEAIAQAWRQVDADFALEPSDVQRPPSEPGVEETVITTYEADDRVYQGIGQLYSGTVYVLLFDGELAAVQRRAAQLNIIATGFEIAGIEQAELTGVTPKPVNQEVIAELETFIEGALPEFGIPGAAVAVVQNGNAVYTGGFGVQEAGGDVPITPDTHMMIGSTGKSMMTMLMATLVDTGEMTWDTPVREVLPEFSVADPELSETMTMRNWYAPAPGCRGVTSSSYLMQTT